MSIDPRSTAHERRFADDLRRAAEGDTEARQRLWADHYEMLKECAKAWFAGWKRGGNPNAISLDGTDIVHAAYERMHDRVEAMEHGKSYFFRAFLTECLRIVVDHYRKTKNDKGRGKMNRVELPSHFAQEHRIDVDYDQLYEFTAELERQYPAEGQVAMLKVFGSRPEDESDGRQRKLTNEEIAELLGMGLRTVEKHWQFGKAWLLRRIGKGDAT